MSPRTRNSKVLNIDNVPRDIHHLILSELSNSSPSSIRHVAQSSKALYHAAIPFIYRNISLRKGKKRSTEQASYEKLLEKFRGSAVSDVARHVRSITVETEVPDEDLIMILESIGKFGRLRELNWNTSAHISEVALEKLYSTWPDLEISVTVVDRIESKIEAHRQMDLGLLSSPLLGRLTYVVYDQGGTPSRSEWPKLSKALVPASNLRCLSIESQHGFLRGGGGSFLQETEPETVPRLDLSLGAKFAKLEELSLKNTLWSPYPWDQAHCRALRDSIDLCRLKTLDFGDDHPEDFFHTFAGHLPNIRSLRFGAGRTLSFEAANLFIRSLSSLESLRIGAAKKGLTDLWPSITEHKNTLKTLILGPSWGGYYTPEYIDRTMLKRIASGFSKLERLGWQTMFTDVNDKDLLSLLSMMNLRKLDLYIHIPDQESDFCKEIKVSAWGSTNPPINKRGSIAAATRIADSISQHQRDPLEWLTIHVSRTTYQDRGQPDAAYTALQLRRNKGQAAKVQKYHVRGDMEWGWQSALTLKEEMLFEDETDVFPKNVNRL